MRRHVKIIVRLPVGVCTACLILATWPLGALVVLLCLLLWLVSTPWVFLCCALDRDVERLRCWFVEFGEVGFLNALVYPIRILPGVFSWIAARDDGKSAE